MAYKTIGDKVAKMTPARLLFCAEYMSNGSNGAKAYRVAYPGCKSGHRQCAARLLTCADIIAEIDRIQAKMAQKTDRTVESLDLMQQAAYDLAMSINQPSAAVSAGTAIARLYGMDKDAGIKTAPEVIIDDSARETVKEITRQYTLRLAQ